jgi:hypothetical protein
VSLKDEINQKMDSRIGVAALLAGESSAGAQKAGRRSYLRMRDTYTMAVLCMALADTCLQGIAARAASLQY